MKERTYRQLFVLKLTALQLLMLLLTMATSAEACVKATYRYTYTGASYTDFYGDYDECINRHMTISFLYDGDLPLGQVLPLQVSISDGIKSYELYLRNGVYVGALPDPIPYPAAMPDPIPLPGALPDPIPHPTQFSLLTQAVRDGLPTLWQAYAVDGIASGYLSDTLLVDVYGIFTTAPDQAQPSRYDYIWTRHALPLNLETGEVSGYMPDSVGYAVTSLQTAGPVWTRELISGPSNVPLPASLLLFSSGLAGLLLGRKR